MVKRHETQMFCISKLGSVKICSDYITALRYRDKDGWCGQPTVLHCSRTSGFLAHARCLNSSSDTQTHLKCPGTVQYKLVCDFWQVLSYLPALGSLAQSPTGVRARTGHTSHICTSQVTGCRSVTHTCLSTPLLVSQVHIHRSLKQGMWGHTYMQRWGCTRANNLV